MWSKNISIDFFSLPQSYIDSIHFLLASDESVYNNVFLAMSALSKDQALQYMVTIQRHSIAKWTRKGRWVVSKKLYSVVHRRFSKYVCIEFCQLPFLAAI